MLRRVTSTLVRQTLKAAQNNNNAKFLAPFATTNFNNNKAEYLTGFQKRFTSKGVKGPTVAVVLSGCGYLDGSEITEAVSVMIHLSEKGYNVVFFAPDGDQQEVIDHNTKAVESNEVRNIIAESSRITRVKTLSLKNLRVLFFTCCEILTTVFRLKTLKVLSFLEVMVLPKILATSPTILKTST
jgi:hypothetical protein